MSTERVYLDWNATTPPLDAVVDAMTSAAREAWGNPASVHATGRAARARLEDARAAVATLMDVDPRDIVFTSGGTEANNLALRSAFAHGRGTSSGVSPPGLATSRLEHPSITRVAEALEREGAAEVHWIRAREDGLLDLEHLEEALARGGVRLVAVQAVNHETGVIQDTGAVAMLARACGAVLHVDAVQAVGRVGYGAAGSSDTQSVAAHKIRGPKGIGALVLRGSAVRVAPILLGGSQERGVRPGTVDPVAAAGFAVAARHASSGVERYARLAPRRDALERALLRAYPDARVNGSAGRVPHVTNVVLPGWGGPELVAAHDLEGVSVSSGSACSAGTDEPSPVLRAMFDDARARSSIRFSMGEATTERDLDLAVAALGRVLGRRIKGVA